MTTAFTVDFQPACACATSTGETSLLELGRTLGIAIESSCGGRGTCRSCAVRIEGTVPPPSASELSAFTPVELSAGWRRACQTKPIGSCTVHVPMKTAGQRSSIGEVAEERNVAIVEPLWTPAAETGCWSRGTRITTSFVGASPLGLAVDLGTTNIDAALVNLDTGDLVSSETMTNPQVVFGADVISRLEYALKGDEQVHEIQQAAVNAIAELAERLTEGNSRRIAEAAVVGNTVMQHLFLGLPIESLSRAPYAPAVLDATEIPATELGLTLAPDALLYCAPNVAGFVGGDHLSALLDVIARKPFGRWAMIDIGTNTEIALFVDGAITSVSCASGPAFEGGKLTCGMRAAPGAIDRVKINDKVEISTIAGRAPIGICGSGVLSLVASLKRFGIVDRRGRMQLGHPSVRERECSRELVLHDDGTLDSLPVVFTQGDVRAVQLAKAAIRAGLDTLLSNAGIDAHDLDRIIIAGAFGRFIDIEDATSIGLLPEIPHERVVQVGNSAGAGVRRIVACMTARSEVNALAERIGYLELASSPCFQDTFIARCRL